jgi:sugar phosphate isomerase/epimerase
MKEETKGPKMGTTLYAFTLEWRSGKYSLESLLAEVSRRKLCSGIEVVGFQSFRGFPHISDSFAKEFRGWMDKYELYPTSLAINADVAIRPDRKLTLDETVEYLAKQIEAAAKLGVPVVRSQMTAKPPVMRKLLPIAEKFKIKVGNELHAPYTLDHPDVQDLIRLYDELDSPWLGFIPDFGCCMRAIPTGLLDSFRNDGVPENLIRLLQDIWYSDLPLMEKFAVLLKEAQGMKATPGQLGRLNMVLGLLSRQTPSRWLEVMNRIVHVHGKFYSMVNGEEPSMDYPALMKTFKKGGYTGHISSEWEGHMFTDQVSAFDLVKEHQDFCIGLLASA